MLDGASVVFYDRYQPPALLPTVDLQVICPLNTEKDISGVCEWCRRCFNGVAVNHSKKQPGNHIQSSAKRPCKTAQKKGS
jgi:hypothetical protein